MNNLFVPIQHEGFNVDVLKPGMIVKFSVVEKQLDTSILRIENFGMINSISEGHIGILTNPSNATTIIETLGEVPFDKERYLKLFGHGGHISNSHQDICCIEMSMACAKAISLKLSFLDKYAIDMDNVQTYWWR